MLKKTLLPSILLFVVLLPFYSTAQYRSFGAPYFMGRIPNAKSEAMGRAFTAVEGDLAGIYSNPAGVGAINGVQLFGAYASPYRSYYETYTEAIGAGMRVNKYLTAAAVLHYFDLSNLPTIEGPPVTDYYYRNMTLNLSSQPFKSWYFGLNINYLVYAFDLEGYPKSHYKALYFDIGAIKKFNLSSKLSQTLNAGVAVTNFTFSNANEDISHPIDYPLPVITRLGLKYEAVLFNDKLIKNLNTLTFQLITDFQFMLNSGDYHCWNAGADYTFFDIFSARIGFYSEMYSPGQTLIAFPTGYGLKIPLDKFTKIPIVIAFDYTDTPNAAPSKSKNRPDPGKFTSYNLKLEWKFKAK